MMSSWRKSCRDRAAGLVVPSELAAQALREIEHKLLTLPMHELSRRELLQIAEGIRDRLFRPVLEAEEVARQLVQGEGRPMTAPADRPEAGPTRGSSGSGIFRRSGR